MFASGPMGLTVLCLFQAGAQLEVGARVETRAGQLPTGTSVMVLATPVVSVVRFAGTDLFQADLSTRILWRPVPQAHARPLFLETLELVHNERPSPQTQWHLDLRASYGEQDYTSLSQQFANQPTLPLATTMFMLEGATDVLWRSSRRTTMGIHLGAAHRRSFEEQGTTEPSVSVSKLPTQTMVSVTPEMSIALSRLSTANITVPFSGYDIRSAGVGPEAQNGPVDGFSVQPQIHLIEQLNRRDQVRVAVGFTYADLASSSISEFGSHVTPLALVGFDSIYKDSRQSSLHSNVTAQTSWVVDPVLGQGTWRGITQMSVDAQMGPRWGAGVQFSGTVDISKPPADSAQSDGTLLSVGSSVRYRWTSALSAEFGGRYSERGPRLGSSDFALHGREVWAFLSLYTGSSMPLTTVHPIQSISGSGR